MSSIQPGVKHVLATSDRLENLPPYTLAKVFQDRDAKVRQGVDVIDLGVGNPDMRPPQPAIDALNATDDARRAKIISVNFPNNPTGGVETPEFYNDLLRFAREYDLFVLSDIAYCDLSMDPSYRARSFLEFDRDKERTVEFHSFSKSYSMQGWRVGMAAGNAEAMAHLLKIKSNTDFGVFMAIQRAAIAVLSGPQDYCARVSAIYRARRDAFLAGVKPLGYPVETPRATLYVWLPIPRRFGSSMD